MKAERLASWAFGLSLALGGCAEPPPELRPMQVSGTVAVPPGVDGPIEVRLYHAWSLQGELRHPLQFIEAFPIDGTSFTHRFDYPAAMGEGLVVYAWLDTDGDGVLCTPDSRNDIAGLTEATGTDSGVVNVTVELTAACRGPDWFFPPVPAG